MIKRFLREIAFMVIFAAAGAFELCAAMFSLLASMWWLFAMDASFAIFAFFVAWLCYRDARTIARWIDTEMDSLRKQNMCLRDAIVELRRAQPDEHEDAGCPV